MQIQPQIFGTFSAIIWAQILHYDQLDLLFLFPVLEISLLKMYRCRYTNKRDSNYTTRKATLACVGLLAVMGGLEALLILTLRA